MFPLLTSPGPDLTRIAVSLQSSNRRVRPRLVWRNLTPLASRVVHGVTSHLSICMLGFYWVLNMDVLFDVLEFILNDHAYILGS